MNDPTMDLFARQVRDQLSEQTAESPSIQEAFEAFHKANPRVYSELVRLARQWKARGRKRLGMKQLFEVLRWEVAMTTEGDDFKLNNNMTSRYARTIAAQEPDLADVFEMRALHDEEQP